MISARVLIHICFLGVMLLGMPIVSQAQFTYTTNNGAITITGYIGSVGAVVIPSTIIGLPVTSIGDWAFYATSVTNVTISDSVTNIGDGVFFNCESLTNVTIGSSILSIGNWTFGFCSNLTSICFRGDVPKLGGGNVFYGNSSIFYYLLGNTNWGVTFDEHPTVLWNPLVPFNYTINDNAVTITGYTGSNGTPTIPSMIDFLPVTFIGDYTFRHNQNLTNVNIPDSVTSIGKDAFVDSGLKSIVIPSSVTTIGDGAFGQCGLTSVTVPDSITNMGYKVFGNCSLITNVIIGNGVRSIMEATFESCTSLTSVKIGTNVNSIGDAAFSRCWNMQSIVIPDSVASIGDFAFINCYALGGVVIPNGVTNLGNWAFAYCSAMTNAIIGNRVTRIGNGTFSGTSLTVLIIPNTVTNIDGQAFQYCGLIEAYCEGNAPTVSPTAFDNSNSVIFYYLPGTTGWSSPFNGFTAILWNPQAQTSDGSFGVRTNKFGFTITGSSNLVIVVEASANVSNPVWSPISTNKLNTFIGTNGTSYFSDQQWTNYPGRFYRFRSP